MGAGAHGPDGSRRGELSAVSQRSGVESRRYDDSRSSGVCAGGLSLPPYHGAEHRGGVPGHDCVFRYKRRDAVVTFYPVHGPVNCSRVLRLSGTVSRNGRVGVLYKAGSVHSGALSLHDPVRADSRLPSQLLLP